MKQEPLSSIRAASMVSSVMGALDEDHSGTSTERLDPARPLPHHFLSFYFLALDKIWQCS